MEPQKTLNSQNYPEPKEQYQRDNYFRSQDILQSHCIKTVWYGHKDRHVDQWKKIKDANMSFCNFSHLIFDKYAKNKLE